jgi:FkbM family methyltransferase
MVARFRISPMHTIQKFAVRAWPFANGSGRIIDRFFSGVTFDAPVSVATTDGFKISIPNDLIGRHIYLSGKFDRSIIQVLCDVARPGDALLDIGANIGYVSACFLQCVPGSTVTAIEPNPPIFDLLRTNLAQFGIRQRTVNCAVSDHDGAGHLETNAYNLGASRLAESGTPVKLCTAESLRISRANIIKIDVEGHEEVVIRSLLPLLGRQRPRVILFEDHGDSAAGPIGALLSSAGYTTHGIHKRLNGTTIAPIRSKADCTCNDYIAFLN